MARYEQAKRQFEMEQVAKIAEEQRAEERTMRQAEEKPKSEAAGKEAARTQQLESIFASTPPAKIEELIKASEEGDISHYANRAANVFSESTPQGRATKQLETLQASLQLLTPRLEGPQSEGDRKLYEKVVGDIAAPVPAEDRILAFRTALNILRKYGMDPRQAADRGASTRMDSDGIPTVNTPEEAARLPSGTKFRTPDGQIREVH
jgi:hypothetical protein